MARRLAQQCRGDFVVAQLRFAEQLQIRIFAQAQRIISTLPGYAGHQLQRSLTDSHRYLLLVNWQRLEDHTQGFRGSPQYQEWKALLHHFYDPFPTVEHFQAVQP